MSDGHGIARASEAATAGRFGVGSMVAPLRRVVMRRPGRAMFEADPALWHYAGPLDAGRLARQYDAFVGCVAKSGAEIEWIAEADDGLADSVFVFDPSFMTPWGAILLRPGKTLRCPEVGLHEALYARLDVPVIGAIVPPGTAEGGDLAWIDESTLAVARGFRTNQAGIDQLRAIMAPRGVDVRAFDLPVWKGSAACLHLLSVISPLDRDLALVYPRLLPVAFYELMRERGIRCLEASDEEFEASGGLNLNVLATAPRRCIAVDGFQHTVRLMRDAGCEVTCFDADALCIPCEGGPTCMALPVLRGRGVASGATRIWHLWNRRPTLAGSRKVDLQHRRETMQVDRRKFLASVGAGALSVMNPEDKAEALEHYMSDLLDGEDPGHSHDHHHHDGPVPKTEDLDPRLLDENNLLADAAEAEAEFADDHDHDHDHDEQEQEVTVPRGTGSLFRPNSDVLARLPANPTLEDFFRLRFWPARHVLQSATHALKDGQPEENILAGLLHDTVQNLIKVDHGWWGAQLYEPYVPEYVSWGIRYHGALRFYPDEEYGYEYPELYNRIFGEDYVPPAYIKQAAEYAAKHPLYRSARMICVNDTYAFQDEMEISLDPFIDIIGRHFKQPKEGLGYDNSPVAHMWRTLQFPQAPL